MMHVEFTFEVGKPKDGVEIRGKCGDFTVRMKTEDVIGRFVTGVPHVHRVLADKNAAIRCHTDGGRVNQLRHSCDELDLPIGWTDGETISVGSEKDLSENDQEKS